MLNSNLTIDRLSGCDPEVCHVTTVDMVFVSTNCYTFALSFVFLRKIVCWCDVLACTCLTTSARVARWSSMCPIVMGQSPIVNERGVGEVFWRVT